ncbi:F-box protein At5g46170-like [Curcuma longa]|uniref:F-box protein At5g46170-like n=1 Tax=Curcuma longa TaxID=136217 RepID=UPI003D9F74D5
MSHGRSLAVADLDGLRSVGRGSAAGEEEEVDRFDVLPDALLLVVFNRLGDVKALGRLCAVSRRFRALVAHVEDVVVRVDCVVSDESSPSDGAGAGFGKPRGVFSKLTHLLLCSLVKPFQALGQILSPPPSCTCADAAYDKPSSSEVPHHSPSEVLKNFEAIRRLRIELPHGELGDEGVLLKWRANFGSTLENCVILCASSVESSSNPGQTPSFNGTSTGGDVCGGIPDSFYTDGSLKRRVVWTISSLIAASARHYLLNPITADHGSLQSLHLTDADGQGVLSMDQRQIQELRAKPSIASGDSQRTLLPALSMRLWYAHRLELPCGMVLKGATLLAIRPSNNEEAGGSWAPEAFEEPYRTATKLLMKTKTYCLEMNSF